MKKIIILLVVLAGILGIAYFQSNTRKSRLNSSVASIKMRELLFPDFDINGIRKVHIKEDKKESTLTVKNDTWVLSQRDDYPVNKEKLQTALMSLKYDKIKSGQRIGKDSWGKVGVNSPGDATAYGVGTLVELFDEKGLVKYSFVLGSSVSSSGGGNEQAKMFGGSKEDRFVRIKDEDTIWKVGDQFPDLVTTASDWLDKSFIDVQKLKSVAVTAQNVESSWQASRGNEEGEFVLDAALPNEKLDGAKVSLGSLLSNAAFNDVLKKDQAAAALKGAVKAKLETFEGFTYNIQVAKQAGADGGGDKYYLAVNVSANIPKERPAVKDEKPEDKKKNDETFATEKKRLEEKLANEKKAEGWVYEVTEYTVSALLKKRAEIRVTVDPGALPAPAADAGKAPSSGLPDIKKMFPGLNLQQGPGAPAAPAFSAPTSSLPETPKTELKPAPAPDANPITGEKPAATAPAPSPTPAPEPAKPEPDAKK